MQYHLDGFRPGDPSVAVEEARDATDEVDVLIVGCGPAGLTLAAQLARFPEITTRIVEKKFGPLEVGQADGIACRSMEMFEAFGFAEKVAKEAYWVNEVAFWRPNEDSILARADRIQDVEDGLSEMPHVILSQARVHDFFLEAMMNAPTRLKPSYGVELKEVIAPQKGSNFVQAVFEDLQAPDRTQTIKARYVIGCDGARSTVRRAMGLELKGQSARQLWGVMDVLAVTDFPDIRLKCALQSAEEGSVLIIPREGGHMVRLYIELDELEANERASDRVVSAEALIMKAQAIFAPYSLDVKDVAWWSAYEIGQRVCDAFDDGTSTPQVYIAGDACHTHSPKAGQGMNVSMADAFNLGWKLAAVVRGQAQPDLLKTYSEERRAKAKELIDFDRDMARLFSAQPKDAAEAAQFQQYFKKHGRYTAGVETRYDPSMIIGVSTYQTLATGFPVGMRFASHPVIRLADAKPIQLGHVLKADGRWRLMIFAGAGDLGQTGGVVARLCDSLTNDPNSPLNLYTPASADVDAVIDVRAVFQSGHREMQFERLPALLRPQKGRFDLVDYEKAFCPSPAADIFDVRGIDRKAGALVVVRPDQFVATVLPLDGTQALAEFFAGFMIPQVTPSE